MSKSVSVSIVTNSVITASKLFGFLTTGMALTLARLPGSAAHAEARP